MTLLLTRPTNPNVILLKGDMSERREEGVVASAKTITPGMLVERTTAAGGRTFQPHSTASGPAAMYVAEEWGLLGDPLNAAIGGGTVDDNHTAGNPFPYHVGQKGDQLWMLLPAHAAAIVLTDFLGSNGDGTVKKVTAAERLFKPIEAVDNSASATTRRIRVEVL